MALFDEILLSVSRAAGWKQPEPEAGGYRFALQGDLTVSVYSPDGRSAVMRSTLISLSAPEADRADLLKRLAKQQAGACRVRASVLAVEEAEPTDSGASSEDTCILFRHVPLDSADAFSLQLRDFVNDLAWWKSSLAGASQSSSPYSMAFMGGRP